MGRGKVEMKRIEAKSNRQVTFSKRKGGLMKKAKELAVLCDVEIGIVIFSVGGKLYEFASGGSLRQVHERYLAHKDAEVAVSNNVDENKKQAEHRGVELLQLLPRHLEKKNLEPMNMSQLVQLEKHLHSILRHAKIRKDKLMAEAIFTLHQKSSQLTQENLEMRQELAATSNRSTEQSQAAAAAEEASAVGGFRPDLNAADDTNIGLAPPHQTPNFLF